MQKDAALATLSLALLSACSPSTSSNDGLAPNVVAQREWHTDTPAAEKPFPPSDNCASTDVFVDSVWPLLEANCVKCHGGAKLAAVRGLDLRDDGDPNSAPLQLVCDMALSSIDPEDPIGSDIFTSVDPALTGVVHDFKFATAAEFEDFGSTVLAWLETK